MTISLKTTLSALPLLPKDQLVDQVELDVLVSIDTTKKAIG
jgi:hypothetical protein